MRSAMGRGKALTLLNYLKVKAPGTCRYLVPTYNFIMIYFSRAGYLALKMENF